jgi:hypothetical protein
LEDTAGSTGRLAARAAPLLEAEEWEREAEAERARGRPANRRRPDGSGTWERLRLAEERCSKERDTPRMSDGRGNYKMQMQMQHLLELLQCHILPHFEDTARDGLSAGDRLTKRTRETNQEN